MRGVAGMNSKASSPLSDRPPAALSFVKRGSYHRAMKRSDEGKVGSPQQTIVEDKRSHYQSAKPAVGCRLHKHRHTKIEVYVVFAENDLAIVPLEDPENIDPVAALGREIDRPLKAKRPHEGVAQSH
ncbi:hypothetical protein LMG27177_07354 [Paraburkholderia fynbosensis]|uniref:Uncharacterized protein n=1 Tax=Paraburkholderia fynbosensis TaxID=1200993 RepID=A0A6J5H163_9BURK|nr:hypothetical protein LMG27177_07354 [Paraburkholderia fynbosensis]